MVEEPRLRLLFVRMTSGRLLEVVEDTAAVYHDEDGFFTYFFSSCIS